MTWIIFILGFLQALFIWYLGQFGLTLAKKAQKEHEKARYEPPGGWPACALITPVAGSHPNMEKALLSLCEQNYPRYTQIFVVAKGDNAAFSLVSRLADIFPQASVRLADEAAHCSQKNWNLLTGVSAAPPETEIFAFCDSTHLAQPDFLRCLVLPIAEGKCSFSTGYHQVQPGDTGIVTLAYSLIALFMRFMQGFSGFTQLWGGAMAMSRRAFEHYGVAGLWARNVVDDCSLTAALAKAGVSIRLCPAALLMTPAANHPMPVWRAWLERQILFLKFCIPAQWVGLGLFCLCMCLPPAWAVFVMIRGAIGAGGGAAPFLALCWLCFLGWAIVGWRVFFAISIPLSHWLWAYFCAMTMFFLVYLQTIFTQSLIWGKYVYEVGKNGVIRNIARREG